MSSGNRKKVVYNIIDSVKGGSGKSTFAVMLSLALDKWNAGKIPYLENPPGVYPNICLVDVDLQGTALQYLLYGKHYPEDKNFVYYNEQTALLDEELKNFVTHFKWQEREFDVVLCSPEQDVKNCYRSMSKQNYNPGVMCSTFRYGFGNMLKKLQSQSAYRYSHIIFDMPPNSDGYSDAVFYNILHSGNCIMKRDNKDKCNLFLMQTLDIGQRLATMNYFNDLFTREQMPKIDKVFFVYTDYLGFKDDRAEEFVNAIEFVKSNIKFTMDEEERNKIYFVAVPFLEQYYRICSDRDGIKNNKMPEGMTAPVKLLYDFNGSYCPKPSVGDLINLINGDEKSDPKNSGNEQEI